MDSAQNPTQHSATSGVSARALSIARLVDRTCTTPGTYVITVTVPASGRGHWAISFYKLDLLQELTVQRRPPAREQTGRSRGRGG
jgi:hypothetical protein